MRKLAKVYISLYFYLKDAWIRSVCGDVALSPCSIFSCLHSLLQEPGFVLPLAPWVPCRLPWYRLFPVKRQAGLAEERQACKAPQIESSDAYAATVGMCL